MMEGASVQFVAWFAGIISRIFMTVGIQAWSVSGH
jgi:hypothetical protein